VKTKTLIALAAILAALVVLLAGHWSSGRAEPVASITLPPPGAVLQLYPGCNNVGLTFGDGTASGAVLDAVSPAGSVETMWRHDAAQQRWEGFSPAAPEASDLLTVNFLDAMWLCLVGSSPTATPTPITPTTPAGQTATPASTATPTTPAGHTATPTSTSATPTTPAGPTPTPIAGSPTPGTVSRAVSPTEALDSFRYTMEWTTGTGADTFTITSRGEFEAGELEAPDGVSCDITMSAGGMTLPLDKVVVIPPDAWIDMGSGWTHTTPSDPAVTDDLRWFCPGSSLFWEGFLPLDLTGIPGQPDFKNGVLATRLSLKGVVHSLPFFGPIPPEATVNTFDIWVAQAGGWLVALEFDAIETADEGGTLEDRIRVNVTNPNDPTISVNAP
jgi:hypothetical protein